MDVLFEFHVRMKDKRTKNNSIERPKGAMHSCTGGVFCCFTFLQKGVKWKKASDRRSRCAASLRSLLLPLSWGKIFVVDLNFL